MTAIEEQARSIFFAALERAPDQWPAYLDEACGGNAELRARVEQLLHTHHAMGSIHGGSDVVATTDEPIRDGPGTVIGPFKLLEQIGEGGFGVVFMAEQTEPVRRKVALKILKPGMDTRQVVARFEAERQALAIMDHPNIAKVFDGGATAFGRPYFVMELVKGTPITEFCDQNHLTPRQRLELFVPVCLAVQHAHQKGIIHRDLKPSNVLVSRHDSIPVVKVIDFGVAKAMGQVLTDKTLFTGIAQMIGTPLYMSPEQAGMSDLDVDTRSDIYSLGVLLYELLTGTTPFSKERFKQAAYDEIRRIIREEEPPKPSTRLSDSTNSLPSISAQRQMEPAKLTKLVRGELDWIVMKALEKDRNRRYETANGFAMDVQRYLAGEAVQAVPPSAAYRVRKFVRRNRGPVLVASVLALVLVAGIFGTTAGMLQAQAERRRADSEAAAAKAVRDFLQDDLLRQASGIYLADFGPLTGDGADFKSNPTINELLDRAAAELTPDKIEAKFPNLPFVQAEVLKAVGDAYMGVDAAKAIEPLTRAIKLYEQSRGRDDPATLAARHSLGVAYFTKGQNAEAKHLLEELRDDQVRVLGPGHLDTFATREYLGLLYLYRDQLPGDHARGIPYFEQLRADADKYLGPGHLYTLKAQFHLAKAMQLAGRKDEALAEFEAIEATARQLNWRPDHPHRQWLTYDRASAYQAAGRYADAAQALELWLTRAEHHSTGETAQKSKIRYQLGQCYLKLGRRDEAIAIWEKNVAVALPPYIVQSMTAIAEVLRASDPARADQFVRSAVAEWKKALDTQIQLVEAQPTDATRRNRFRERRDQLRPSMLAVGQEAEYAELARKAISMYERAAAAHRGDAGLRLELVRIKVDIAYLLRDNVKRPAEAADAARVSVAACEQAKADFPESADFSALLGHARYGLGWSLIQTQAHQEAVTVFRQAIAADEEHVKRFPADMQVRERPERCYHSLAIAVSRSEGAEASIPLHERALELAVELAKEYPTNQEYARRILESHGNLGDAHYQAKRFDAAGRHWQAILDYCQSHPEFADNTGRQATALRNLAKMSSDQGKFAESCEHYSRVIKLDPKDAKGWNSRGVAYTRLNQLDKAVADFTRATDLGPKVALYWRNRGITHRRLNKFAEAAVDFSKAIELDIKDAKAWYERGVTYFSAGQFEKALSDLTQAIELDSKNAAALSIRATAHARLGQWDKAVADLTQHLELAPKHPVAHNDLAWLLATCPEQRLRDPKRAVDLARKAIDLDPKNGTIWNTLGAALVGIGEHKEAIVALKKSMDLRQGGDAFDWFFLAMAHCGQGDKDEARKWYDKAVASMATNAAKDEELIRFRLEAEAVLDVKEIREKLTVPPREVAPKDK